MLIKEFTTVYAISKLKGEWKVNKTKYDVFEVHDDFCIISPTSTLYRNQFEIKNRKLIKNIFNLKVEAEKECELRNSTLYERYEKMEDDACENDVSVDFRECIGEQFSFALRDGKGDMTLSEFLEQIEDWYKTWGC